MYDASSTPYVKALNCLRQPSLYDVAKKAYTSLDPEGGIIVLTGYWYVTYELSFVHDFAFCSVFCAGGVERTVKVGYFVGFLVHEIFNLKLRYI